jgi:uncharacterized protein (TIGR02453 family)
MTTRARLSVAAPDPSREFAGFSLKALQFLRDLAQHNDRDWFQARKSIYDSELQEPFRKLIVQTSQQLQRVKVPLRADAKRSVFRIYRDVRFSPDKSPYKTHVSVVFDRHLTKGGDGILYVHIQPGESFTALAFYQPIPQKINRLRESIVDQRAKFLKMLAHLKTEGLALSPDEDALKRVPRGFEEFADSDIAQYLKNRSFIIRQSLPDTLLQSDALPEKLVDFTLRGLPFLKFGWAALRDDK